MSLVSREAFDEKYMKYSQELMNVSYGYTKSRDDSFDIIQNVFLKYFNLNKSFINDNDEKYWLIRVTINESKDYLRKKKRIINVDDDKIDILSDDLETKEKDERLDKLSKLVKELPEKYKSVIVLHYYDKLTIIEISNILKISLNAVKKRLERSRKMLKEKMEEWICLMI